MPFPTARTGGAPALKDLMTANLSWLFFSHLPRRNKILRQP